MSREDPRGRTFGGPDIEDERRRRFARLAALLHTTDDERIETYRDLLAGRLPDDPRRRRVALMLGTAFYDREPVSDLEENLETLWSDGAFVSESRELLGYLDDRRREALHRGKLPRAPLRT